jgi:hypothetical protein
VQDQGTLRVSRFERTAAREKDVRRQPSEQRANNENGNKEPRVKPFYAVCSMMSSIGPLGPPSFQIVHNSGVPVHHELGHKCHGVLLNTPRQLTGPGLPFTATAVWQSRVPVLPNSRRTAAAFADVYRSITTSSALREEFGGFQ